MVGLRKGDCIQLFEADAGFQAGLGIGHGLELVIGSFEVLTGVAFALASLVVNDGIREQAGRW